MIELSDKAKNAKYFTAPQFSGTLRYHKVSLFGLIGTDGCIHAFETLEAFWIADIIASYIPKMRKTEDTFFVARVIAEDGKADFYIDDGNDNVLVHQKIPYTDIKENLKLYVGKQEKNFIAFLPSED